jgi:hypothetical protein
LAKEPSEGRVGLRVLWICLDDGSHGGEGLVERARGFEHSRFDDPGRHGPRGRSRNGAERGGGGGAAATRHIEFAEPHLGRDKVRLQGNGSLVAGHRPVVVAQAVDDVGQKVMCARKRGVEAESGRERLGRLFETAQMH